VYRIEGPLECFGSPLNGLDGLDEELQLCVRFDQPVGPEGHRAYRNPARHGERERVLGRLPELPVEQGRGQRDAPSGAGRVGVFHLESEPPRREPPLAEPPAQGFRQPPQHEMQHAEVIGIARQRMGQAILRFDLRRQHRPGIDAAGLRAEQAPAPPEHRAKLALADGRDLADPLELVVVEPPADVVGHFG
jgi:hypothetical protein